MAKKLVSLLPWFGAIFHPQNSWSHYEDGKTRCLFPSWLNSSGLFYYHIIVGILLNCWLLLSISEKMKDVSVKLGKISIVANTWLVLRWMCDSPRTGCARRITLIYTWREQANNRVMVACNLYCCLLPQCEALHACRSGFPIATLPSFALRPCDQRLGQVEVKSPHLITIALTNCEYSWAQPELEILWEIWLWITFCLVILRGCLVRTLLAVKIFGIFVANMLLNTKIFAAKCWCFFPPKSIKSSIKFLSKKCAC